jgi:hypothetical protein
MDALVHIHSWHRWVVLAVLLFVGLLGLVRAQQGAAWGEGSERPFTLATIIVDLQLTLGIVLWIGNKGWDEDFFIRVIHPTGMLLAAVVAHILVARARKGDSVKAYRLAAMGLLAALVIVALTIPRYAWF